MNKKFYNVRVQGMNCLLWEGRMTDPEYSKLLDSGWSWYTCIHSETDWSLPVQIQTAGTRCNFWGYLFTPKPLKIDEFMGFPTRQIPRLIKQLTGEIE